MEYMESKMQDQLEGSMQQEANQEPEVLFFGCLHVPGHSVHSKRGIAPSLRELPWGASLDAGLLQLFPIAIEDNPALGKRVIAHKDGWVAFSFWDRSGDKRPNSNSAFVVHAQISGEHLLSLARVQWPEIFARPGFPIK